MSNVGLNRASLFGIKKENTLGVYEEPVYGSEVLPLRPGNVANYEPEKIENDELLNDIGAAKAAIGKEAVSGTHPAYLRHSGIEGVEPQLGVLYESILGSKYIVATQEQTIAGSTTTVLKLGVGKGVNCRVGQAVLIKDGVNGYQIRNIKSIDGDDLTLNFKLDNAPAAGIGLGKAVVYIPAAQGHPNFSTTKWLGNGFAKECTAGNTVTQCNVTAAANGYGEVEFSYEGTQYLYNPLKVTSGNKFINIIEEDDGEIVVSVPEQVYKTPIELSESLMAALNSVSTNQTYTVEYNNQTGKFEIKSDKEFNVLFDSGDNAANSLRDLMCFLHSDKVGQTSYVSDSELDFSCKITPLFDGGDIIVMKNVDLFIGDQKDNVCICAQEVGLTISKEVEDVDCMCEPSGIAEKIPTGRVAEMTVSASLKKFDASLLDSLLKNKGIQAMMNAGKKTGGNWVAGQCFNIYLQSCTVSSYTTGGDSFIQMNLTLSGYVSTNTKDVFLNFV